MPIFNCVLLLEKFGWGGFRRVELEELSQEELEALEPLLDELPEGAETVAGVRFRWRPE